MNKGFLHTIALIGMLLFATGCSNFQKILKSNNVDEKYKAALQYYEKGDYYRANQLFEQVLPLMTGRPEAEQAKFYFANTYFQQKDYLLSAFHFKSFYDTYQRSPLAEQALFMQAKSLYNQSPGYEQDQSSTLTAIEALQEFQVRYPQSELTKEANAMIDALNMKLDKKAYDNAKLYYQIRYYRSAVVAFNNFIKEHASSPYSEEAAYLRLDAQYRFAQESVPAKQQERYMEALDYYQTFVDQYPDSKFKRSAEQVYDNALAELEKVKKQNQANS
ncbi:outer membrane protein assembly factor BamD [Pontibacter liquoris]|uniref:outer membrane protein assembly factor BamD n=1 Tax=Pontibacter liquoris TaxID=2905677 RepID=UPI001FA7E569|nr:outer membrane protein assembly factor BamD [Pontibacter liquoris]